jgi:mannose-6-phosphate isomerase-like protein (cupin superfamily)
MFAGQENCMAETPKRVIWPREAAEFRLIGGCVKRLVHPATTGSENLGLSIVFMSPGERVVKHRHPNEEAYFIVSGTGMMTLEDHPDIQLEKNMAIYIPSNAEHSQENTGDEPLVLIAALSPPLTARPEITEPNWQPPS